ncbi:XPG domain containing-domain-containing protein [Truncatella angustata]|uniref:XPG domain containing-domain-containing protein n=1 Tax=Truncatella angustata TaxID=152316 RepID=A0A9P8UWR8_9PEZI|nr:XPG domain containing-domain-containing protein [Truncatella angustata]KAH6659595.1 XPG domain containing-domain-containing protein [Truncatella angustata]
MGIRGLTQALKALPVSQKVELRGKDIVIDGPALVHRIWELLMQDQHPSSIALGQVAYAQLGQSVIGWLDDLRDQGANVRKIYFDGYLPPFKWQTRKERLVAQTMNVQGLATKYRNGVRLGAGTRADGRPNHPEEDGLRISDEEGNGAFRTSSLRFSRRTKDRLDNLPKHPFLIPSVIDSLKASDDYVDVVELVPGEADVFCADDIRQNGGLLFTGDSDLLIQDLGPDGSVVFFWDLWDGLAEDPDAPGAGQHQSLAVKDKKVPFKALSYSRYNIERVLGIEGTGGLPRLVFEWQRRRETLLQAQAHMGPDSDSPFDEEGFNKFLKEHIPEQYIPEHHPVVPMLFHLDPRVSEFVIQSLTTEMIEDEKRSSSRLLESVKGPRGPEELSIFLPTMIEDTTSKSAWEYSQTTRQLAYGLARTSARRPRKTVIEYRTLLSTKGGRKIDVPERSTVDQWCEMLVATLDQIDDDMPRWKWLAFALYQEIQLSDAGDRPSMAVRLVREAVTGVQKPVKYSWQHIHLGAVIQASFYSLRILKQLLDVRTALKPEQMTDAQKLLHQHLMKFPLITDWPSVLNLRNDLSAVGNASGLTLISRMLGIPEIKLWDTPAKATGKKRKLPVKAETGESLPPKAARSSNPFEALEMASE